MSEPFSTSILNRAAAERQAAETLFASDRLSESRAHAERALALLGRPMPQGRARLLIALLAQLLRQIRNRLWLNHFPGYPLATQALTDDNKTAIIGAEGLWRSGALKTTGMHAGACPSMRP